ncbi:response regulator transcription factor [Aestuariirhabdus litorea]|uniref:DNA-binding response regulator n=1 Tax=Aestuariirhabdus litorea TaxID=2528527 RepID=A0A3P3VMI6_9GAMM|nr:response regulator transcription factor [Aestuariirhabdus litorea]RRJ83982.1 DNA-binding response regulator [Aestuariirhabdus litorea]RWW97202.1 response regulator [Endozoicomonadaceae bacterium GTF-13]
MKLLLIEDDDTIARYVCKGLQQSGYGVDRVGDGEEGLALAIEAEYDLAIVDLMLPGRDGLSVIAELRARGSAMPVLVLSARRSVEDRVRGLETGGDDYLTKPFSFSELLARVQALLRRSQAVAQSASPARLGLADLELDSQRKSVTRGGQKIHLQPREFQLLEYLLRHPGRVVTKTMILEQVWDYGFDPQTNVVDVLVCRLRSKIDKGFEPRLLHTLRGVGYVLKLD